MLSKGQGQRVVNVKDFGAAGDGEADDTDAIALAFEAAGTDRGVFFPPGQYRFNGIFGGLGLDDSGETGEDDQE